MWGSYSRSRNVTPRFETDVLSLVGDFLTYWGTGAGRHVPALGGVKVYRKRPRRSSEAAMKAGAAKDRSTFIRFGETCSCAPPHARDVHPPRTGVTSGDTHSECPTVQTKSYSSNLEGK